MQNLNKYIVFPENNIRTAIKKMDAGGIGFIVCAGEDNTVIGVISDGDFRRAILSGISLDENVLQIANRDFKHLLKGYSHDSAMELFNKTYAKHIPVLDNGKLVDIITKDAFFNREEEPEETSPLKIPLVIMAGGKGTRLDPFTRILPKPLIPIGDKPMIEVIMSEFAKCGINKFYISVNHKAKMIKAYFDDYDADFKIEYIDESQPLGTAGALKFLEEKIASTFFVSNCDIIIKDDYCKIHEFHKNGDFDLTIVASMQHHTIPYGVCEIGEGGHLVEIKEKPEYDFLVNTGVYLLEPSVLKLIPPNKYFDMPDLISKCQNSGFKVGVFPVSENSYVDVGQLAEYKKNIKLLYNSN